MDELYQEYDQSGAITDEAADKALERKEYDQLEAIADKALERIKSAGMQDEYEAIKHHLRSSVTLINNLLLAAKRKDRLNELVNEDNTKEAILEIIQYLENCRKGGSKPRFLKFEAVAMKMIEERKANLYRKGANIADMAVKKMVAEKVDKKLIPSNPEKIVCNLIKEYLATNKAR